MSTRQPPTAKEQFTRAYRNNYARVLAYLKRRTPLVNAEDLAAETFIRAWRGWEDAAANGPESNVLPWLYGIARNVMLEFYRSRDRTAQLRQAAQQKAEVSGTFPAPDDAPAVEVSLDVQQALNALSSTDREIIQLHAWEGLEPKEIAEALNIRPGSARVKLHRARQRLDVALTQQSAEHTTSRTEGPRK